MNTVSLQQNNRPARTPQVRQPERMASLASLPVFFKLDGKRAIVAGGTDAAAWKAELLAASGADVHVYAVELDPAFDVLLSDGRVTHHARPWTKKSFSGAAIAVADADTDGAAKAFLCAAHSASVPVNVIDKPEFCQFQFGSIVNRSPVVIGISTDGAAPILGQAIRRRIETLIPPALAHWAALAKRVRAAAMDRLKPGAQRRAFWEKLSDRAFDAAPPASAGEDLLAECRDIAGSLDPAVGSVTLVGAGPGDAELLTLKAVRALQAADVILFDDLVADEVLELARREARRMLVGKRGGRLSCNQDDINEMMVSLAKSGKRVVRLKSGDPMIFGRAGEEIAHLERENISVSVIPGITAGSAMAAMLGISLTHRDHAQSVRLVTGHSRKGDLPTGVDWHAIADPAVTTLFYMGGRMAGRISRTLIAHGLSGETPAVMCSSVSRPGCRRWSGTVATLSNGMETIVNADPVLIGIGTVFADTRRHLKSGSAAAEETGDTAGILSEIVA